MDLKRRQAVDKGYQVDALYPHRQRYTENCPKCVKLAKRQMNKNYRNQLKKELTQEVEYEYECLHNRANSKEST